MGQNQSSEKEKTSSTRGGTSHADKDRDRKVNRKTSTTLPPMNRVQAVDPSESNVAAKGATTHTSDTANLEKMLQSTSPELTNKKMGRSNSRRKRDRETIAEMTPQPVPKPAPPAVSSIDIPTAPALATRIKSRQEELEDNSRLYDGQPTTMPPSQHRPPRFPLPIAEVPDSPNLAPINKTNSDVPIFDDTILPGNDVTPDWPRRNSLVSVATQDEEDVGEELQPFGVGYTGQTVPYTIEWKRGGEKVFVTGTFAAWDKKYRLRKNEDDGIFRTVINLPPGTHHLKFFVDNNMVTSSDLPTAVDFNNILVNYIEISTDDIPTRPTRRESGQIPTKSLPDQAHASPRLNDTKEGQDHSGTVTPGEEDRYSNATSAMSREEVPEGDFRQVIPQALLDIDLPEDDPRYKNAARVISESGMPPSLPLFLSRSILNAGPNVGVKDDSSVLAMPNHTVLNHLMTSNVKNGVLATSVTTRYKKKYVTTISFKPIPKNPPFGESTS